MMRVAKSLSESASWDEDFAKLGRKNITALRNRGSAPTIRLIGILAFSCILVVAMAASALAQSDSGGLAKIAEIELYVKIALGVITALAALLGLPMIYLTYRKTSAEIRKLELEANQLSTSPRPELEQGNSDNEGFRVHVQDSPNANVQILADPRFLAPLLVLLDFIFVWIILSLTSYLLRIFSLGDLGRIAFFLIALFLLMPLANQVLKIRHILQPPAKTEQSLPVKQLKAVFYLAYGAAIISSLGFGILILYLDWSGDAHITLLGRYFAGGLVVVGLAVVVLFRWARRQFNSYLTRITEGS